MNMNWTEDALLHEIGAYRFAIIDLGMFLDTHPCDDEALRLYTEYNEKLAELEALYTRLFGPITMQDVSGQNGWTWGMGEMPENRGGH